MIGKWKRAVSCAIAALLMMASAAVVQIDQVNRELERVQLRLVHAELMHDRIDAQLQEMAARAGMCHAALEQCCR